jgi:hypothetical protein
MRISATLALANVWLYLRHPRPIARFVRRHHRLPNAASPRSYIERMLWRKLVDRNPMFVLASDKLACKEYVRSVCPDLAVPETLWSGDDPAEIPDSLLQRDVYLKANHASSFNRRVRPGDHDRAELERLAQGWLSTVYGRVESEWAYSEVRPRIFLEACVGDATGDLLELNVRAASGRPIRGSVIGHNKTPDQWSVYLDLDGRPVPGADGTQSELPPGVDVREPYLQALEYTARLGREFDYARFDFFWNGRTLYAGEITIYPGAGISDLHDPEFRDVVLGGWDLRESHFLRTPARGIRGLYADALRRRLS